jgi:hypothetical protein
MYVSTGRPDCTLKQKPFRTNKEHRFQKAETKSGERNHKLASREKEQIEDGFTD